MNDLNLLVIEQMPDNNKIYTAPIFLFPDETNTKAFNKIIKAGVNTDIMNGIENI